MPVSRTITAQNSILLLQAPPLFPALVQMSGFMADRAFEVDDSEVGETVLGVDGNMSVGLLPSLTVQRIMIMPDSVASDFFEYLDAASQAQGDVYILNGSLTLPATQMAYTMTKGILTRMKRIPDAARVLQGRPFQITWQNISYARLAAAL